jgi:hypothetical protein
MMNKRMATTLAVCVLISSCADNSTTATDGLKQDAKETIVKHSITAEQYKGKLDDLLTLEMAAAISGQPAAAARKSPDTEEEKKINKISISYSWKNDKKVRTVEVMNQTITTPVDDQVQLSWVKNTTLEAFKQQYRSPTAAEQQQANTAIENKVNELKQEGKATATTADQAKDMAQNAMKNYRVEEVPNTGDYAVFTNTKFAGVPVRELVVFYNGLSFTLLVDVSGDPAINDAKAIELANTLIREKLK